MMIFFVCALLSFIHFPFFFFFNDTATTEIYTLSLHDALPIFMPGTRWASRHGCPSTQAWPPWHELSLTPAQHPVDGGVRRRPPRRHPDRRHHRPALARRLRPRPRPQQRRRRPRHLRLLPL